MVQCLIKSKRTLDAKPHADRKSISYGRCFIPWREMQALTTSDGRSWLWNGDTAFWGGRSPILFRWSAGLPAHTIEIDGVSYPMSRHGFARRAEFALAASTATACRYELAASQATKAVYPFDFLLAVERFGRRRSPSCLGRGQQPRPAANTLRRKLPSGLSGHGHYRRGGAAIMSMPRSTVGASRT